MLHIKGKVSLGLHSVHEEGASLLDVILLHEHASPIVQNCRQNAPPGKILQTTTHRGHLLGNRDHRRTGTTPIRGVQARPH